MKPALVVLSSLLGASATISFSGVAESGGEFGVWGTKGTGLPGEYGVTYAFINSTTVDIYVEKNHVC